MQSSSHRPERANLSDARRGVKQRRGRQKGRSPYLACGPHAALAFARARPEAVRQVLIARGASDLEDSFAECGIRTDHAAGSDLDRMTGGVVHQGVVALGEPPEWSSLDALKDCGSKILVVLDGVTDPRNVGAIFRSAEAAGVGGVIMAKDRAPSFTPALVKAAAGAVEWLPAARVTNIARAVETLSSGGHWILGLAGEGSSDIWAEDAVPGFPAVLIVGAEGDGIRPLVRRACHRLLRIPMAGETESLNAAVAAGVAIFELRRLSLGAG